MIRINLLAPESIKKEERTEIFVLACVVSGLICLGALTKYFFDFTSYKKVETRIEKTQNELNKYEEIVRQVEALQATKTKLVTKKDVISTLMAVRLIYPVFMETLVDVLPQNVWFRSLNSQLGTDGTITVNLDAEALDNYSIADFITGLMSNNNFTSAELGPIKTSTSDKLSTSGFTLTFTYKKKQ